MKAKDIAWKYSLDSVAFSAWLIENGCGHKSGVMGGVELQDGYSIEEIVVAFEAYQAQEQERLARLQAERKYAAQQEAAAHQLAEETKRQALASMLITSGFHFDGYTITRYSGYISGDDAVQIDRGASGWFSEATDVGASLMAALVQIRRNALAELKEAAYALGCNAVIGVDFDYLTLEPETATSSGGTMYLPYVFGVTANGNAVVIEKSDPSARV